MRCFELGAWDRRTDGRTVSLLNAPYGRGLGHNKLPTERTLLERFTTTACSAAAADMLSVPDVQTLHQRANAADVHASAHHRSKHAPVRTPSSSNTKAVRRPLLQIAIACLVSQHRMTGQKYLHAKSRSISLQFRQDTD